MDDADKTKANRLPHGGLDVLTQLIMHQDSITWTALSIFLTGELLLFALVFQSAPGIGRLAIALTGAVLTVASAFILVRSHVYLTEYFRLAKERASEDDLDIFEVDITKLVLEFRGKRMVLPRTFYILLILHAVFLGLWAGMLVAGLLPR
jgi:hypothetical protein